MLHFISALANLLTDAPQTGSATFIPKENKDSLLIHRDMAVL